MEEMRHLLLQAESGEVLLQVVHASAGGREVQAQEGPEKGPQEGYHACLWEDWGDEELRGGKTEAKGKRVKEG